MIKLLKEFVKIKEVNYMLMYGLLGMGKIMVIFVLVRELYGDNYRLKVLELNVLDECGIGVVREKIKFFVNGVMIMDLLFKLVILDEVDYMIKDV